MIWLTLTLVLSTTPFSLSGTACAPREVLEREGRVLGLSLVAQAPLTMRLERTAPNEFELHVERDDVEVLKRALHGTCDEAGAASVVIIERLVRDLARFSRVRPNDLDARQPPDSGVSPLSVVRPGDARRPPDAGLPFPRVRPKEFDPRPLPDVTDPGVPPLSDTRPRPDAGLAPLFDARSTEARSRRDAGIAPTEVRPSDAQPLPDAGIPAVVDARPVDARPRPDTGIPNTDVRPSDARPRPDSGIPPPTATRQSDARPLPDAGTPPTDARPSDARALPDSGIPPPTDTRPSDARPLNDAAVTPPTDARPSEAQPLPPTDVQSSGARPLPDAGIPPTDVRPSGARSLPDAGTLPTDTRPSDTRPLRPTDVRPSEARPLPDAGTPPTDARPSDPRPRPDAGIRTSTDARTVDTRALPDAGATPNLVGQVPDAGSPFTLVRQTEPATPPPRFEWPALADWHLLVGGGVITPTSSTVSPVVSLDGALRFGEHLRLGARALFSFGSTQDVIDATTSVRRGTLTTRDALLAFDPAVCTSTTLRLCGGAYAGLRVTIADALGPYLFQTATRLSPAFTTGVSADLTLPLRRFRVSLGVSLLVTPSPTSITLQGLPTTSTGSVLEGLATLSVGLGREAP